MIVEFGVASLVASIFFSIVSAIILYMGLSKDNRIKIWGPRLSVLFLTITMVLLTYLFISYDFNVRYVFDRTSTTTPLIYRLSAIWAGQAGTFLLWGWVILVAGLFMNEKQTSDTRFKRQIIAFTLIGGSFFGFMTFISTPFAPTINGINEEAILSGVSIDNVLSDYQNSGFYNRDAGFIEGKGLNPMLQTPYNALHPPLMFFGYGLVFVVFASSFVYLKNGTGEWEKTGRNWARLSWLFMTSAIALGGLWAYEELAFGGYWTWDPIESASLLPWLTLSAYIHGSIEYKKRRKFGTLGPLLGVSTTLLIIYSTYITRSGIIKSSHSYAGTTSAQYLIITVVVLMGVTLYYTIKRITKKSTHNPNFQIFSQSTMLQLSVVGLVALAVVIFWGLTNPVLAKVIRGIDETTPPGFYNKNGFYLTIFILLILGINSLLGHLKKEFLGWVSIGVIGTAIVFYGLKKPSSSSFLNTMLPIAGFTLVAILNKIFKTLKNLGASIEFFRRSATDLAHLGIVFIVVGAIASGSFTENFNIPIEMTGNPGKIQSLGQDYDLRFDDIRVFQDKSGKLVQEGYVALIKDDKIKDYGILRMVERRQTPFIIRGRSDIYGVFYGVEHQEGRVFAFFNFKIIPLVNLIWLGALLLIMGMTGVIYIQKKLRKSAEKIYLK